MFHVQRGPDTVIATDEEVSAVACKVCKARKIHVVVMLTDSEPSYYEPLPALRCKTCGTIRPMGRSH